MLLACRGRGPGRDGEQGHGRRGGRGSYGDGSMRPERQDRRQSTAAAQASPEPEGPKLPHSLKMAQRLFTGDATLATDEPVCVPTSMYQHAHAYSRHALRAFHDPVRRPCCAVMHVSFLLLESVCFCLLKCFMASLHKLCVEICGACCVHRWHALCLVVCMHA